MAKKYSKQEIISFCEKASENMPSFYQESFVKNKGKTKEGEYYTEIIAEWLLDHFDKFAEIPQVERMNSYKIDEHTGEIKQMTNRVEERVAKMLYNTHQPYNGIGEFIDYQTPLKNIRADKGVGKIDLLSRNDMTRSIYIIELKKKTSPETMLRCVLECYTYLRTVSKKKLFESFNVPADYELKASPLVYKDGLQFKEYKDKGRKHLHLLMEKLECTPFFVEEKLVFDILTVECDKIL